MSHLINIFHEFQHLITALNAADVPYALCGGLAMAVPGYPWVTKDIALLIHPDDLTQVEAAVK